MRNIGMLLGLVGVVLVWAGCASTIMVFTEPGDAEIIVDGEMIGRSPVLYAGRSGLGGSVEVTARLPEFEEKTVHVSRMLRPWGWYFPDSARIHLEPVEE